MQAKADPMPQEVFQADTFGAAIASSRTGLLLIGHGTRSAAGREQCIALVDLLRQFGQGYGGFGSVELAFLELAEPAIEVAVARLVADRVERITVVPLLLFAAGHARHDIPRAVRQALAAHQAAGLPWVQAEPLGCHPAIVELSARQAQEVAGELGRTGDCLLIVGRGTSDPAAQADFMDFVALRRAGLGTMPVEAAYLAQARPTLHEQLQRLAATGFKRIVVQPHLLFAGELIDVVRQRVEEVARHSGQTRWLVVPPLAEGVLRCAELRGLMMQAVLTQMQEAAIRVVGRGSQR